MIHNEVIEKLATLITAAFGFVAALTWNDAMKSLFEKGGPLYFMEAYSIWIYALGVTILAVFVTIWISKISEKIKK